jgi:hypothetical protein
VTTMMPEEDQVELCAQAAHEANRIYSRSLGDHSHADWANAPDWQKKSARAGVRAVLAGQRPPQLHESWMAGKLADGWTLGPVKDELKKQHPCMVPFDELPAAQRAKDLLFHRVVEALHTALCMRRELNWAHDPCASGGRMRAFAPDPLNPETNWDVQVYPLNTWHIYAPDQYTPAVAEGVAENQDDAIEAAELTLAALLLTRQRTGR